MSELRKLLVFLLLMLIILSSTLVFLDLITIALSMNSIYNYFTEMNLDEYLILRISVGVVLLSFVGIYRKKILKLLVYNLDPKNTFMDFKNILLSIDEAVIATDKHGRVKRINKSAEEMLSCKYIDIKGKDINSILHLYSHKAEKEIKYSLINDLLQSEKNKIEFSHLLLKSGNKNCMVSIIVSKVFDDFGNAEGAVIVMRDVTEMNRIVNELSTNRNEMNLILSNMREGIYVINKEGYIKRWSQGAERIFEIEKEKVIDRYVWEVIPKLIISRDYDFDPTAYKEITLKSVNNMNSEFLNKKLNMQIITPNGNIKSIESYNMFFTSDNNYFLASIFRDISDDIAVKESILKSEEKFTKIFELSPVAIIIADLFSGEIIDLNQSFENIFGWQKNNIIGKSTLEFNFWLNSNEKINYVKSLIKNGEVKNFVVTMKTRKGKELICAMFGTVININNRKLVINYIDDITKKFNEEVELQRITADLEDKVKVRTMELELINDSLQEQIFERINTETALRESEEKFRSLIEQLPVGIYRTTPNGMILQTNPALANILGFDSEEQLKEKRFYDFFKSIDKRNETYYLEKFANEVIREETKYLKADGSVIWVFNNAKAITDTNGNMLIDGTLEDITYRKHAQAALLESKEKYRRLFDNLSEIYLSINESGNLMEISPSFEKISGFKIQDFLGKNIASILSDDEVNEYFIHAYKNIKEPANFIISIKNSQNKICFLSLNLKPNLVSNQLYGFDAIARDITGEIEHNNITDTLYAISRAVNLTDSLDDLFKYIHKALSQIIDTTNFFFALVDYEKNLIQFPYLVDEVDEPVEAIPFDAPDSYTAKVIMSGEPILRRFEEIEYLNKKDEITGTYSLVWLGVPLKVKDTVIGAMVVQSYKDYFLYNDEDIGLMQSVSDQVALAIERKRNQIELNNQYKFVQNLLEAIPNPVYYKDIHTKQYLMCNKAFADHLGFTEEEIIGKRNDELVPSDFSSVITHYDSEIKSINGIQSFETKYQRKDGAVFNTIVYRTIFVDSEGNPAGIVGAINDITATKLAEEEIIKALKKEQELGELKSNFISMVSHEYRTPLQAMMMSSELLHDYWDKLNFESREKQFDRIKNSIKTLNSMLDDVILLNKSERGALVSHPAEVVLSPICQSLTREMQFLAKDKCTVELIVENPEMKAIVDEKLLHLVLTNLLSNAVKYSKKGGNIEFKVNTTVDELAFTVKDCGIGIPLEEQKRLFEPFFRSRNVGTISGTGLGLAIVRDAIKALKGSIDYESIENVGTTFYVKLPNGRGY